MSDENKEPIPYNLANFTIDPKAQLSNGMGIDLPDHRRIEVWDISGGPHDGAFCIRMLRPDNDGRMAVLSFALQADASAALQNLLTVQLLRHFGESQ